MDAGGARGVKGRGVKYLWDGGLGCMFGVGITCSIPAVDPVGYPHCLFPGLSPSCAA